MYVNDNLLKQFEENVMKKLEYLKQISEHQFEEFIHQVHKSFVEWFVLYFQPEQPFIVSLIG